MKVLHIGQMVGGLEVYIRNSISYASGQIDYVIISGADDGNKPVSLKGIVIKEYKVPISRNINCFKDISAFSKALKITRNEKPDIIHCHSSKAGLFGRVIGFVLGIPTVYTPNGFSFLSSPSGAKRKLYTFIEKCTKCGAYLLACGESEESLGANRAGYSKDKLLCWRNAVPDLTVSAQNSSAAPYISIVGRPSYQKNPELVVEVIKEVHAAIPDLKFVWMGVGYYCPKLEVTQQKIKEYDLEDTIELLPWLSHDDVLSIISGSLCYMTLSRYEGLPFSVLEAMCLGKPVVATSAPGNVDCVTEGVNGYVVSQEDVQAIAQTIISLVQDKEKCIRMGKESRRMFESDFDLSKRISLLEDIYKNLIKK